MICVQEVSKREGGGKEGSLLVTFLRVDAMISKPALLCSSLLRAPSVNMPSWYSTLCRSNSSQHGIDTTRTYSPSADEISCKAMGEDERKGGRGERGKERR